MERRTFDQRRQLLGHCESHWSEKFEKMVAFEHPPGCGQGAGAGAPDTHDMFEASVGSVAAR